MTLIPTDLLILQILYFYGANRFIDINNTNRFIDINIKRFIDITNFIFLWSLLIIIISFLD